MVEPLPSWESSDEDEKKSLGSGERTPLSYISYHSYESDCRKSNSLFSDDSELSLHEIKQGKFLKTVWRFWSDFGKEILQIYSTVKI